MNDHRFENAKNSGRLPEWFKKISPQTNLKIGVIAIWVLGLSALFVYYHSLDMTFKATLLKVFAGLETSSVAPLVYILIYILSPLFLFFPSVVLTVLSGMIFGLQKGVLFTIIGANLSATFAYSIGHFFSYTKKYDLQAFNNWSNFLKKHPFMAITTMRLSFMPFDLVNYGAGILKIPYLPFISASFLSTLLAIITFVTIGASLSIEEFLKNGLTKDVLEIKFILLSAAIFAVSLILSKVMSKYSQRHNY